MHSQSGDVHVDLVGDRIRQTLDVQVADLEVEQSTFFHTDRRAVDVHRNGRADHFVHHHADEIDMRHLAADRIDLDLLDHRVTLLIGARHP